MVHSSERSPEPPPPKCGGAGFFLMTAAAFPFGGAAQTGVITGASTAIAPVTTATHQAEGDLRGTFTRISTRGSGWRGRPSRHGPPLLQSRFQEQSRQR